MSDVKIINTGLSMKWIKAINYAADRDCFIPTYEEAEELINEECWTCTSSEPMFAYVNQIEEPQPVEKSYKVILIEFE